MFSNKYIFGLISAHSNNAKKYIGSIDLLKLHLTYDINNIAIYFDQNCRYGNLITAKWLYQTAVTNDNYINIDSAFDSSCVNGHLKIAKWLRTLCHPDLCILDMVFIECCEKGHLKVVKWLNSIIDNTIIYDIAFRLSCKNGHLKVAKYLLSLGNIDIGIEPNELSVFELSCYNGHLNVAKWLYKYNPALYPIDISDQCNNIDIPDQTIIYLKKRCIELFIIGCCGGGKLDIVKWLHRLCGAYMDDTAYGNAFTYCCGKGDLGIAKWLHKLCKRRINSTTYVDAFRICCKTGNIRIAKWLQKLHYNCSAHDIIVCEFGHSCMLANLEMAKWLYSQLDKNDYHMIVHVFERSRRCRVSKISSWLCSIHPELDELPSKLNELPSKLNELLSNVVI